METTTTPLPIREDIATKWNAGFPGGGKHWSIAATLVNGTLPQGDSDHPVNLRRQLGYNGQDPRQAASILLSPWELDELIEGLTEFRDALNRLGIATTRDHS